MVLARILSSSAASPMTVESPVVPREVFWIAGVLILLGATLLVNGFFRRFRKVQFDWREPEAVESEDYPFCDYENRFAYSMSSITNNSGQEARRR